MSRLLPEGVRCTAYWYAQNRGLPVTFGYLLELGLRAARLARWHGIWQSMVREGYPDNPLWVHTWPACIFDEAARGAGAPCPPAPPQPPVPATRVVNFASEPYQVYIGRPGPWGNPFVIGRDGTRNEVIAKYSVWVRAQPGLMAALPELRGKVLGCHCKPEPCHGDILAALADGRPPPEFPPPPPHRAPPPASQLPPDQLISAWHYADLGGMLVYDKSDAEFVRDLACYAAYVGGRRGLAQRPDGLLPVSVWRDVSGAMAQRGAEKGDTDLDDLELDAVADGYLPEPEYRPGAKPSPAQFMAHYDDGSLGNENSFWSYPPPPEDTQAYLDWTQMASDADREYGPWVNANYESDCDGCSSRIWAGDAIRADGRGGWLCAICGDEDAQPYETRDAGWGEGQPPWDGDDINHSAWDPGWPPMSSEDM